jgi:hypothetical protein
MKKALRYKARKENGIVGDISGLCGNADKIHGDVSEIRGDVDECELSDSDRSIGVNVKDLLAHIPK